MYVMYVWLPLGREREQVAKILLLEGEYMAFVVSMSELIWPKYVKLGATYYVMCSTR